MRIFNGTIRIPTTGGAYQIDSADANGSLTLGGTIANALPSTRVLNFIGAGHTLVPGTFTETADANSKFNLVKSGTGDLEGGEPREAHVQDLGRVAEIINRTV